MESLRKEVQFFLKKHAIALKKSLGQHFLVDEHILHCIVQAADIQPNDHIIEIGPGIGILTRELLKHTQHITAIELDSSLIPLLNEFLADRVVLNLCHPERSRGTTSCSFFDYAQNDTIHHDTVIIQANTLTVPLPSTPYKIVANIPYHITSPLLRHAFVESIPPLSLTLLIQREVADKIADTKNASRLTVLVGLFGTPHIVAKVPPSAFLPPPKVDSAVLHISAFQKPKAEPKIIERVFALTHAAFGQKRKMLRNTIDLKLLEQVGIDPTRRPQTLSIDEWIALAQQSA